MSDREREDAVLALHRAYLIDEAAHQRQRRGIAADLPAVVQRHHRPGLAADGAEHDVEHFFGAFHDVGVRELLVENDHVGEPHPLHGQVAVRIEFHADHAIAADQVAHARDDVAFHVVIAVRHHRTVQAEQHAIHGPRTRSWPRISSRMNS